MSEIGHWITKREPYGFLWWNKPPRFTYLSGLSSIFAGAPLKVNGTTGNIQTNLTALQHYIAVQHLTSNNHSSILLQAIYAIYQGTVINLASHTRVVFQIRTILIPLDPEPNLTMCDFFGDHFITFNRHLCSSDFRFQIIRGNNSYFE